VNALVAIEGRPWAEWKGGKPLSTNGLARLLRPFTIAPEVIRLGTGTPRGYMRVQFDEAFERYLGADGPERGNKPQQRNKCDERGTSGRPATATLKNHVAVSKSQKPASNLALLHVAVEKGGASQSARTDRERDDIPDFLRRCDHCGHPARPADPLAAYDWSGRPDGVRLHARCEALWFDRGAA